MPETFLIGNEYKSGHIWKDTEFQVTGTDGTPHYSPETPFLPYEITKKQGLCNLFRIFADKPTFIPEFTSLLKDGYSIIVDFFRCEQKSIDFVVKQMERFPGRVWGCLFGELDSNCPWHQKKGFFSSKKEAAFWFKESLVNNKHQIRNRKIKGEKIKDFLKQETIENLGLPLIAQGGMPFGIQYYYEQGFPLVWLERNCWLDNTNVGIAFLRGLAKQYNRLWGLDFSPWGGADFLPTHYDKNGNRLGGITENLLLREWITAFLTSANMVHEECADITHWLDWQGKTYSRKLSPCGKNAKKFADFALRSHRERGKPYVPVALMLEHDHGWNPPVATGQGGYKEWVWGNKMPYGNEERMIEAFFDFAFPGYKEAAFCYDKNSHPELPWSSRREYLALLRKGYDMRPLEKGISVPTPFGDSFNVVLENCPLGVLKEYQAVTLLGGIKVDSVLKKKLHSYVESGGTLIVNSKQLSAEAEDLTGVKTLMNREAMGGYSRCLICGQEFGEGRIHYLQVKPKGASVVSCLDNGDPLITSYSLGRGKVIFTAPWYLLSFQRDKLSETSKHFLSHLMAKFSPVKIAGPPIQYHINLLFNGKLAVSLINNSNQVWEGELFLSGEKDSRVVELWREEKVKQTHHSGKLRWDSEIKPFGFAIYEINTKKRNWS